MSNPDLAALEARIQHLSDRIDVLVRLVTPKAVPLRAQASKPAPRSVEAFEPLTAVTAADLKALVDDAPLERLPYQTVAELVTGLAGDSLAPYLAPSGVKRRAVHQWLWNNGMASRRLRGPEGRGYYVVRASRD